MTAVAINLSELVAALGDLGLEIDYLGILGPPPVGTRFVLQHRAIDIGPVSGLGDRVVLATFMGETAPHLSARRRDTFPPLSTWCSPSQASSSLRPTETQVENVCRCQPRVG